MEVGLVLRRIGADEANDAAERVQIHRALRLRLVALGMEADDIKCRDGEVTISIGEMNELLDRLDRAERRVLQSGAGIRG